MKRIFIVAISLLFAFGSASAQTKSYKFTEKLYNKIPWRHEFVLPQVDGLNCYTAELHAHTVFSDGEITPEERVKEAWIDGLDILAMTDHIETRRHERDFLKFLKGYSPDKKGFEPINTRVSRGKHADERGIVSDLNFSTELALKAAQNYPELTIIKGVEISREPVHIGHYCALFTTDNNAIYSTDDAQAIRNARAQGAIIMHNHPGWRRSSLETHAFEDRVYSEGLIDGIEVMNNNEFYPKAIDRAINLGFFIASNTDIHGTIAEVYGDQIRDFTMIFANELTEEAIREALLAHRTVAYSYGTLAGEEKWLKPLFEACVDVEIVRTNKDSQVVRLVNKSSLPFVLKTKGGRESFLAPDSSANFTIRDKGLTLTVENMWCGADKKLSVTFMPQK